VWVRSAAGPDADRLAAEARLQASLGLPGVAPVVEHGVSSGIPYVAVSAPGRPLVVDGAALDAPAALVLGAMGARILRALALAGASVPDAEPERFLHAPPASLTLADLNGARSADPNVAAAAHAGLAKALVIRLLAVAGERRVVADLEARSAT